MDNGHAFLPPSGAAAWSHCALWPTMNRDFPQDDSIVSLEGTAAHWVAWEMLAFELDRTKPKPFSGSPAPNGQTVTDEMLDGAELLIDTLSLRQQWVRWEIEKKVPIQLGEISTFGTPDAYSYDPVKNHLGVIDYKFGHRFVDEFQNKQGILYVLGILSQLKSYDPTTLTVAFTIVQPRCYYRGAPVRTWEFTYGDIVGIIQDLALAAFAAMYDPIATTNPGCSDCPGRHSCDALQRAAYSDAELSFGTQPHTLSPTAAALELRILKRASDRLTARIDGLEELTISNLRSGTPVPFWRLDSTKPHRKWNVPVEQIVMIGEMMGKPLTKPGVVTPAAARKLGIDESIVNANSIQPEGSLKLVPENSEDAKKVFGNSY